MKVAFVDNMNNNFFAFARYFRDFGIEADVYCIKNSSMKHFDTSADTFQNNKELRYIKIFPSGVDTKSWIFFRKKKIYDTFKDYDIVISCGRSSAFLQRAGLSSDIIIPYGSDLYSTPFKKFKLSIFPKKVIKSFFDHSLARYQIKAYFNTKVLITDTAYTLYKEALKKLQLNAFNFGMPMLYNFENIDNYENKKLWGFLDEYDFIVFNHSRQHWISNNEGLEDFDLHGGLKRNDKLIIAFAKFIKITKFKKPILVLFEYGSDVKYSKKLINDLNIENYVVWMPTMFRKNILYGLNKATFSSNAFRDNLIDIGGVCYESLATGTPHLNNCIDSIKNPKHKFYKSPMIHALSEKDILYIFMDYEKNPQKYNEIRKESKNWFNDNLGLGLAKKYKKLTELLFNNEPCMQNNKKIRDIFEN